MTEPIRLRPLQASQPLSPGQASFGSLHTSLGHLPLQSMHLKGRLSGLTFRLILTQRFYNRTVNNLEAVYIFPLPARAAVTRFLMRTRDREVVGRLKERGEARHDYERAIRAGHQAALAEEDRPEVFTMKVGNLPAGQQVEVELELAGPLALMDGMATFRFPLVVAPRFMPGQALVGHNVGEGVHFDTDATPDASRISPPVLLPGYPNPVHLSIDLALDMAGFQTGEIESSLPQLQLETNAKGTPVVRLTPSAGHLKSDLILRIPVLGSQVQACVQQVRDQGGKAYTWSLVLLPPEQQQVPAARNLVVLLDRSGSMGGWKMASARRAAGRVLDSLQEHDRFAALVFDDTVENLTPGGLRPAGDQARFQAVSQLARVVSRGGTEMAAALVTALQHLGPACEGPRCLILITDGQVGNEDQILREIRRHGQGVRIFCVGIDRAVNAGLLTRIARDSGGTCELVESEASLEKVMLGLQRRLLGPVLTDVELEAPPQAAPELAPTHTDLFPGLPARLYGRTLGALPGQVWVRGRDAQGQLWRYRLSVQTVEHAPFRQLWAREVILELEHGFITGKAGADYKPQAITRFSLAHNVLSRFTAFVAVDESSRVNPGQLLQVVQPVDLPAGWEDPVANGSVCDSVCDLMVDRSAIPFHGASSVSNGVETLAKEKPALVAARLKQVWLEQIPPRDWRQCLEELRQAQEPERRQQLLRELLALLKDQPLDPELLMRGLRLLRQQLEPALLEPWLEEVAQALEPSRTHWWRT
ncbi:MAG: VIT domain-containing protein [Vulcanimicrobiota bacterium]